MQQFSIQRDDGLGNQICNRLLAEVWASNMADTYEYFHSTAHRIAHINFGTFVPEITNYIDALFFPEEIRSKHNNSVPTYTTLGKAVGLEALRQHPTHFEREDFTKYKNHFHEKTDNWISHTNYAALHIRRGDFVRLNEARLKPDEYYIRVADILKSYNNNIDFIIETDSPEQVQQLSRKLNADINIMSTHCDYLMKNPHITIDKNVQSIWNKLIQTIQAVHNLANSDYLVPSESGFSNVSHILGKGFTIFPASIFCRHHKSKQCNRIKNYINSRESLHNMSNWPEKQWNKYTRDMEEMVGPLYRIYNFSFLKDNNSLILQEL